MIEVDFVGKCNRCGEEITWKFPYQKYLELKKANPNLKNTPLNPDGSQHYCEETPTKVMDTSQENLETFPSADNFKKETYADKVQIAIIRQTCVKAAARLNQGTGKKASDVIKDAKWFEEYVNG